MTTQRIYAREVSECVHEASALLGASGRPVYLDSRMEGIILRQGIVDVRTGFATAPLLREFSSRRAGHTMTVGLERLRVDCEGRRIHLVRVHGFTARMEDGPLDNLWIVPAGEYARLYRFLRRTLRHSSTPETPAPVMHENEWRRLYDNTIGFLRCDRNALAQYDVPQKRGVLFLGSPGNGKTMAGRWLASECHRLGLFWRHVTVEVYERTRQMGRTNRVFELAGPGIVLFDDFEIGLRHRDDGGPTSDHSILLGELDGIESREGVVYVFTTNARIDQLDPAFLRRGRIDQVISFPTPPAELRRRLIMEFWHRDIVQALDVTRAIDETEGLSFAELSELKKLLVMRQFDTGVWDWEWALRTFRENPSLGGQSKGRIGFGPSRSEDSIDGIAAGHRTRR